MIHKGLRGEMICATSGLRSSRARMKYVLAVGSSKIDDVIVTFIGQNTRKRTFTSDKTPLCEQSQPEQVTKKARGKLEVLHGRINDQ